MVIPILHDIGSDVEVTPAKVIDDSSGENKMPGGKQDGAYNNHNYKWNDNYSTNNDNSNNERK